MNPSNSFLKPPDSAPSSSDTDTKAKTPAVTRRWPAWAFPVLLVLAFAAIVIWSYHDRLLPAQRVSVAPVILLADLETKPNAGASSEPSQATDGQAEADFAAPMQFQAAGWFEPDPLPIRATALVDGVLESVHVLEGESVRKGQLLAKLIPEDTDLSLAAAKSAREAILADHHMHLATIPAVEAKAASLLRQMEAAEAKLEELKDRNKRIEGLSKGTISEQEATAARLAVASQEALIEALKADHAAELANLDAINVQSQAFDARIAAAEVTIAERELASTRTEIVSPVDGVVLELKAAPGQKKMLMMDNPESATIAVLFETGKLQARVDVALADASGLAPGQAAIITTDFLPNTEFRGRVTRIVGAADLQRNTLQAKVRVLDPDTRLRPEMLCRVKFLRGSAAAGPSDGQPASRALFIPAAALSERSGETAQVWVVTPDGTHTRRQPVIVSDLEIDAHIGITSGLMAGQQVILPPHENLTEHRRIQAVVVEP